MSAKKALDIFAYQSYKSFLKDRLSGEGQRGQMSAAADYIGCQRSYLGRVVKEKVHLSADMNFKLTQFLKFCEDERDYFLLLVEVAKSESKEYKNLLFEKMKILKQTNDSLAIRSKRNQFVFDSKDIFYFSNWLPATIHLLTSIPKLQTSLAISKKLNLHEDHVIQILKYLLSQNFVTFDGKNWKYKSGEIHLNKESPLFYFHHQNWRSKAITQAQSDLEGIHGTYIYTLKTGDIEKIKSLILKLISDLSEIAGPSEPEECVAFTCDFFKV